MMIQSEDREKNRYTGARQKTSACRKNMETMIDEEVEAYRTRLSSCLRTLDAAEASAVVRLCRVATESILEFVATRPRPSESSDLKSDNALFQLDAIAAKIDGLPMVLGDALAAQLAQSKDDPDRLAGPLARLNDAVQSNQTVCSAHILRALDAVERVPALTSERLASRFDAVASQISELVRDDAVRNAKSVLKGAETERRFVEALIERLARSQHARLRGAVVERCSDVSRACDAVVRCEGKPSVRIELKTYTNPVPTSEVAKFYRDLEVIGTDHGLFVSTDSRIVGKDPFTTERISMKRTRYAMFLPDNGHDMAYVESALVILWLLDEDEKEDGDGVEEDDKAGGDEWLRVSTARYDQVRRIVDEHVDIFKSAYHHADMTLHHARETQRVLKKACLRDILLALEGQDVEAVHDKPADERPREVCPGCHKPFVHLAKHKCRRRVD